MVCAVKLYSSWMVLRMLKAYLLHHEELDNGKFN